VKKILKILFGRMSVAIFLALIQLTFLIALIFSLSENFIYIHSALIIISFFMVVHIVNMQMNPSAKLPWIMLILFIPVFGGLFYILFGINHLPRWFKKKASNIEKCFPKNEECSSALVLEEIKQLDSYGAMQSVYIAQDGNMPVFKNTYTEFLSPGEVMWQRLKDELEKAEKFIFLEYFIIEEGVMWNSILEILERKAASGVDIRLIYDDFGCLRLLPSNYVALLAKKGIKALSFNPVIAPFSSTVQNRDHRKITVIDGKVGFIGGINLADEYINVKNRFGHWKDASLLLRGEAVTSLTKAFLTFWFYFQKETENTSSFLEVFSEEKGEGFVQPYVDSPFDGKLLAENVYINMINSALHYVYIETPYLIVDNEVVTALILAAKKGVDVRIVTPFKEDKKYVHWVTRSYYQQLLEAGVKIYEYTPGFIHSKVMLCDDVYATVGTINLDYRSLYHHFECGVFLNRANCLEEIKKDFFAILEVSEEKTLDTIKKIRFPAKLLKILAPLM